MFQVSETNGSDRIEWDLPVAKIQRVIQAFDAFGVEPLQAASALKHLHIPFPLVAAITIFLLVVLSVVCVP